MTHDLSIGGESTGSPAPSIRSDSITETDSGSRRDSASGPGASASGQSQVNRALNQEGLPEGWTMQVAPNGRVSIKKGQNKGLSKASQLPNIFFMVSSYSVTFFQFSGFLY